MSIVDYNKETSTVDNVSLILRQLLKDAYIEIPEDVFDKLVSGVTEAMPKHYEATLDLFFDEGDAMLGNLPSLKNFEAGVRRLATVTGTLSFFICLINEYRKENLL